MNSSALIPLWLGLSTLCLLILTGTVVLTAWELRRTLRQLRAVLPDAETALHEVARSLRHVRRLAVRADVVSQDVETVVHRLCGVAGDALMRVQQFADRVRANWSKQGHNGAGAEPRRHHRGSR
jgi:hypothetical protein